MRVIWFFIITLVIIPNIVVIGQCPIPDFSVPVQVCTNETFQIINDTNRDVSTHWDFCPSNVADASYIVANPSNNNIARSNAFVMVKDTTVALMCSGGVINKANFVDGINGNNITYEAIQNSSVFSVPHDFKIIKEENEWIGFIANESATTSITRINFGSVIGNTIKSYDFLLPDDPINATSSLALVDDNVKYLFSGSSATGEITTLNFGNSFINTPVKSSFSVPGVTRISGFAIHKECNGWVGFIAAVNQNKVYRLDFSNGLDNAPVITEMVVLGYSPVSPYRIEIVTEMGRSFLLILEREKDTYVIEIDNGTYTYRRSIAIDASNMLTMSLWASLNATYIFGTAVNAPRGIHRVSFVNDCMANQTVSEDENPFVSYSQPGFHPITLTVTDQFFQTSKMTKYVNVVAGVAPSLSTSVADVFCLNSSVNFTFTSDQTIEQILWNFGDNTSSMLQAPSHNYIITGDFIITLEVESELGCKNITLDTITIYDPPVAEFSIPGGTLCTNNDFLFSNTTEDSYGGYLSYLWYANTDLISEDKDLVYSFPEIGSIEIKLIASVPGCQSEATETISNVEEGPEVDFSYSGQCEEEIFSFTNNSQGDIVSYLWTFEDGKTSDQSDPSHTFTSFGNFNVILQANSPNGCQNSTTKPITIYSKPQPDFSLALPPFSCSGTPSQFTDTTSGPPDSNLSSWQWDFGDNGSGQNTSVLRNPQHTYLAAGDYDVSLTVGTNYGCEASVLKQVTIAETPIIEILNTPACKDAPVTFTAATESAIKTWNWQTGIVQYTIAQPTHTYTSSGDFSMSLNVVGENDCIAAANKNIVVPLALGPDFSVDKNCVDQQATFTDITTTYSDPIVSHQWDFAGLGSGSGSPAVHVFQNTGSYNVTLNVTTASGCVYSGGRNISITTPPLANFTALPEVGVPPLQVQFTNTSANATHYLWEFNDPAVTTSTQVSPQFIFNEYGNHIVDLTAFNAQNCRNTFSKVIRAELPVVEIALIDLILIENPAGVLTGEVIIRNNGNMAIQNLPLLIDLSGVTIQQVVPTVIAPNATVSYLLSFTIMKGVRLDYICVRAEVDNDSNPENNVICTPAEKGTVVFSPHPNPTPDFIHIDWIASEHQAAAVSLYDALGKVYFNYTVTSDTGFNSSSLDISTLDPGIYFLVFRSGEAKRSHRIVVWR